MQRAVLKKSAAMFLTDERKVESLKLSGNIFFIKCFCENPEYVRLLIRVILERNYLEIKSISVRTRRTM